jgi:protein-S-isoprenylcysteine O-methyltransferase Ste14
LTRRERLARAAGALAAVALLAGKLLQLPSWPGPFSPTAAWTLRLLCWLLETGIVAGYLAAFLTRERARRLAEGPLETAFPLAVAALPLAITLSPYGYDRLVAPGAPAHAPGLLALLALQAAGQALNLAGLLALRRSFSLMSEARSPVLGGPYRWIRHPLYAGHLVAFLATTLLHWSPASAAVYALFAVGQYFRARVEEGKMAGAFPEYAAYRAATGMFLPRLRR